MSGTVLGVVLLGAIGPALTFLGVSAYWERAIQGAIILARGAPLDALARGRSDAIASTARASREVRGTDAGSRTANGRCCWRSRRRSSFFSAIAPNFFTLGNFFEITRLSVELGLLAVALTPVIVIAGGIDLSVGVDDGARGGRASALRGATGICRCRWRLRRRARWSGCAGGALNALLIARLELPAADRDARHVLAVSRHGRRA